MSAAPAQAADAATGQRVSIVTPAAPGSRKGNRATAVRIAALLRQLGCRPHITTHWDGAPTDVLIAVHAHKSADAVFACAAQQPAARIVVLLAGTDLHPTPDATPPQLGERALAAAARADALVALHSLVAATLPEELRHKTRTIVQSATAEPAPRASRFTAVLLAHLRPVKQPLLAVQALRAVPADVPFELVLAGGRLAEAGDEAYAAQVEAAVAAEPRARFVGELPRRDAKRLLAAAHVCLVPSNAEGGANVVSEAIAAGVPVLCSDVAGNVGLLGADWPGTFPAGDAGALGALLTRCVREPAFLDDLCRRTQVLQPMVAPAREREAWRRLLAELG